MYSVKLHYLTYKAELAWTLHDRGLRVGPRELDHGGGHLGRRRVVGLHSGRRVLRRRRARRHEVSGSA